MNGISILKRNKNEISKTIKKIEKEIKSRYGFFTIRCNMTFKDDVAFGLDFQTNIKINPVIRVVSEKGLIYFCLDLTKTSMIYAFDTSKLGEILYYLAYPRRSDGCDALREYIDKYNVVTAPGDVEASVKEIENSSIFTQIKDSMNDAISNCDISLRLKDGEWPRLKDRSILPILIWDVNKYNYDYFNPRLGRILLKSYKTGRFIGTWSSLDSKDIFHAVSSIRLLFSLLDVEIKGSTIKGGERF